MAFQPSPLLSAYRSSYSQLVTALPIDQLIPDLYSAGVMPGNLKDTVLSKPTRADKARCLLDAMEAPLLGGIDDQFEEFVSVMERYVERENDLVVKRLAKNIRTEIAKLSEPAAEQKPDLATKLEQFQANALAKQVENVVINKESLSDISQPKIKPDAPPLVSAISSGRYQISWVPLADLPVPLCYPFAVCDGNRIFVTSDSSVDRVKYLVLVYSFAENKWAELPPPGQYFGMPQIVGGKLVVIGGRDSTNNQVTNRVSTYDEQTQTWVSHYSNMLGCRSKPGVATYLEHVIVAGGRRSDKIKASNDIEVLNWVENRQWRQVQTTLPISMYSFTPTISDGYFSFAGFCEEARFSKVTYRIPVTSLVTSVADSWEQLGDIMYWNMAIIPQSSPLVVVGGNDDNGFPTASITMYKSSSATWEQVASLYFARADVAAVTIGNNAVVVLGGYTDRNSCFASSLKTVELGQAVLVK